MTPTNFPSDELLEALEAVGARFDDPIAALIVIESYQDAMGDARAAEAMARIRRELQDTPAGLALDRVLFGPNSSQRQAAKVVGTSRTTLARLEAEIRERVPPPLQWYRSDKTKGECE
jgi:hypothetical protein